MPYLNYLINVEVLSSHRVKGELKGHLDFVLAPFAIPGHPPDIFDHLFVKFQAGHVTRPLDADEFRPVKNMKILKKITDAKIWPQSSPGNLNLLTCAWGTDRLRNLSRNAHFLLVVQVEAFVYNLIGVLVEGSVVVVVILTGKQF